MHLFGYGPEFFQYLFPLVHPRELSHLNVSTVYFGVGEAHNNNLNRWVELGFFGLASHLVLLATIAGIGIRVILTKGSTTQVFRKLAMAAVLAAVVGRSIEQLAGIPHLSDEALFWIFLAVVAALPKLTQESAEGEANPPPVQGPSRAPQLTATRVSSPALRISLALVLASVVLGFTLIKNANYALAEKRATSATAALDDGRAEIAMRSIDRAIALASDVGRYRVIRANILDKERSSTPSPAQQAQPALEAYQANSVAVSANPFDMYSRLHAAESALTLAALGQPGKSEEAIEEYRRLTLMQPRFWLTHFLLGRAYVEAGEPDRAIDAYTEAIKIDPMSALLYERRAEAHEMLGELEQALQDYDNMLQLHRGNISAHVRKAVTLFQLDRSEEAILHLDEVIDIYQEEINYLTNIERKPEEVIKVHSSLALALNNRGSAFYQLGRIERSIEDYNQAVNLSPLSAEYYVNRAQAYALLNKNAEAKRDYNRALELGFKPEPEPSSVGQN